MTNLPVATTHLTHIADNWRALAALQSDAKTGAVVKANAYGHGSSAVAGALARAGCRSFFVAHVLEGVSLRAALGPEPEIFVFHGFGSGEIPLIREARLIPVLNTLQQVGQWREANDNLPAAIHIDTGMNRLGLRPEEAGEARDQLAECQINLVMSHLTCADEPGHDLNQKQLSAFTELASLWPGTKRSLANTAGTYLGADYGFELTRPGIGLYGGGPTPPAGTHLKPGLTLTAPVLSVFEALPGETSGYGATYMLDTPRTLATVAFGYADGYPRAAANSGFAMLRETRLPVVGRVSMGLTTLDITETRDDIEVGSMVEFLGGHAHLEEQAIAAGTLGYELVTGLGHRVERIIEN